jgi:hypothetical protein
MNPKADKITTATKSMKWIVPSFVGVGVGLLQSCRQVFYRTTKQVVDGLS